jgi:hypothetical protein
VAKKEEPVKKASSKDVKLPKIDVKHDSHKT